MRDEIKRLDPLKLSKGTGVLGRISGKLNIIIAILYCNQWRSSQFSCYFFNCHYLLLAKDVLTRSGRTVGSFSVDRHSAALVG